MRGQANSSNKDTLRTFIEEEIAGLQELGKHIEGCVVFSVMLFYGSKPSEDGVPYHSMHLCGEVNDRNAAFENVLFFAQRLIDWPSARGLIKRLEGLEEGHEIPAFE